MNRACRRFPIPKTIEWNNDCHYVIAIDGRDKNSGESDASHGCGKKHAKLLKTRKTCATEVRSRKSCKNIDGSHHAIDDLNGKDPERVTKKNENRRRGHKGSTGDVVHTRRSHQSRRRSDSNGQIQRRKSLQSVSSKACSDAHECLKAEDILREDSDEKRQEDPKNYELRPNPTGNSDLPISMLACLLSLKLADAIEQGLYSSSDDSAAMDCRKN